MNALVACLALLAIVTIGTCRTAGFKGTRTYNLETDDDRYGRYERVLLGIKTSEGLRLDPVLLDEVRQVLLEEERQQASGREAEPVSVQLYKPLQSRHIAQLLYRAKLDTSSANRHRTHQYAPEERGQVNRLGCLIFGRHAYCEMIENGFEKKSLPV